MKKNNKAIFWSTDIIKLIDGLPIGGLAVQMYLWALTFVENGWEVFSFAKNANATVVREGIVFHPLKNIKRVNIILEWFHAIKYIWLVRPTLLVYRGSSRHLLSIAFFSRLFGVKLILFGASDSDFEVDRIPVGATNLDRRMYLWSLRHIRYFITQNRYQHDMLLRNFGKESLVQFNIWGHIVDNLKDTPPESDVVWVANLRKLKRAEWVLDAAKKIPNFSFVLAGGPTGETTYYEEMQKRSERLSNVSFLGGRSFYYTNKLVQRSRVLLCTSTYEGFPNTFLQAWSAGIPVISTVDPSDVIRTNHLGVIVSSEEELQIALIKVLCDCDYYSSLQDSVKSFFIKNHSAQSGYRNVLNYINE